MKIEKFHTYAADLNPRFGTEPGKIRPVVVIQSDLLNNIHPSTVICPLTTKIHPESNILRVHIKKNECGLLQDSDILLDQMRAIDNRRFKTHLGELKPIHKKALVQNLKILIFE